MLKHSEKRLSHPQRKRSTLINVLSEQELKLGNEKKFLVRAQLEREGRLRDICLVRRSVAKRNKYVYVWNKMKEIGIPTFPTLRIDRSNDRDIYITYLKHDDSELYGKAKRAALLKGTFCVHNLDELFLYMIDNSIQEIEERAKKIADLASENGVLLPIDDAFELIVRKDGSWEIISIDLDSANCFEEFSVQSLKKQNDHSVYKFIQTLRDLKNLMENQRITIKWRLYRLIRRIFVT